MSTLLPELSLYATSMTSAENKHTLNQSRAERQIAPLLYFSTFLVLLVFLFSWICQMSCQGGWEMLILWFYLFNFVSPRRKEGSSVHKRCLHNTVRHKTTIYQQNIVWGNSFSTVIKIKKTTKTLTSGTSWLWIRDEWSHSNQSVLMISSGDEDLDKYTVCKVSKGTCAMRVLCFYTWGKYFQEVFIIKLGVYYQEDQLLTLKLFIWML